MFKQSMMWLCRQAARYAKFFGIKAEEDAAEVSEGMKQRGERGLSGENLSRNLQSGQIQTAADRCAAPACTYI